MLGRKKKIEPPRRRQLQQPSGGRSPQTFMYRSLRSESAPTLGRRAGAIDEQIAASQNRSWLSFFLHRAGFVLGTGALIVCLVELLLLSSNVKIVSLSTTPQSSLLHSTATYQQAAAKLFAASLANSNKVTVDTAQISKELQDEFPELSRVSITLPLIGHRPVVYLQTSQPAFVLIADQRAYVIGQQGHVLAQADQATIARGGLPVITDHSGINPDTNPAPLPSSDVTFITDVLYELKHAGITVSSLNLPAAASEFDVSIKDQPFSVKFNMQSGTARQQSGTFLALWQYLQQHHVVPSRYIDVRVDGRAYYK